MQIRIGWSAEINSQWQKLDVDVTEQDLLEFFVEKDAAHLMEKLTPKKTFILMSGIAEELILAHKASHYPVAFPVAEVREELRVVLQQRQKVMDELAGA